jgi:hypothetical protein
MRNILRLEEPFQGSVKYWGEEVLGMEEPEFNKILLKTGVLLSEWSSTEFYPSI